MGLLYLLCLLTVLFTSVVIVFPELMSAIVRKNTVLLMKQSVWVMPVLKQLSDRLQIVGLCSVSEQCFNLLYVLPQHTTASVQRLSY